MTRRTDHNFVRYEPGEFVTCPTCHGSLMQACPACDGVGCAFCDDSGEEDCEECEGAGIVRPADVEEL